MLARLGDFAIRRRRLVLIAAAGLFVVSGALGGGVAKQLSNGGFSDDSAESSRAEGYLKANFESAGTPNIVLLVTATDPGATVDSPAVAAAGPP